MDWYPGNGGAFLVVGAILIATSLLIGRSREAIRRGRGFDAVVEAKRELATAEATLDGKIAAAEVRMHQIVREAEARLATRIAVLQELLDRAERLEQPSASHDSRRDAA